MLFFGKFKQEVKMWIKDILGVRKYLNKKFVGEIESQIADSLSRGETHVAVEIIDRRTRHARYQFLTVNNQSETEADSVVVQTVVGKPLIFRTNKPIRPYPIFK